MAQQSQAEPVDLDEVLPLLASYNSQVNADEPQPPTPEPISWPRYENERELIIAQAPKTMKVGKVIVRLNWHPMIIIPKFRIDGRREAFIKQHDIKFDLAGNVVTRAYYDVMTAGQRAATDWLTRTLEGRNALPHSQEYLDLQASESAEPDLFEDDSIEFEQYNARAETAELRASLSDADRIHIFVSLLDLERRINSRSADDRTADLLQEIETLKQKVMTYDANPPPASLSPEDRDAWLQEGRIAAEEKQAHWQNLLVLHNQKLQQGAQKLLEMAP